MGKLEVANWQFDEIESLVRLNPGGLEWVEANLVLKTYENVSHIEGLETLYVFFGTLDRMDIWKRQVENHLNQYDRVVHATQWHKIEGLRAKPKRVYDLDGDKKWYFANYHDLQVKRTLEAIYQLEYRYGRA